MKTKTPEIIPHIPIFDPEKIQEAGISFKMTLHLLDIAQIILPIYEKIFKPARGAKMRFNAFLSATVQLENQLKSDFLSVNSSAEELNIVQEDNDDVLEIVKAYCSISLNKKKMEKFRQILKDFNSNYEDF